MSLNNAVQHLATGTASTIAGFMVGQTADGKLTGFPLVGLFAAAAAAISLVVGGILRPASTAIPPDTTKSETTEELEETVTA
jgi:hypothetical protein